VTLNAQVFTEYFENAANGSNLEDYNDWYVSFKASEANGVSPVIDEEMLFYDGYAGSDMGKSVFLDSLVGQESATQRISTKVVTINGDTLIPHVGSKMYYAAIVSILPNSWGSYRDFMTWEASTGSSFTRGRVFAKVLNDNADLQLAVSKNSSSELAESDVIAGGVEVYHLLVLVYEAIEGDGNDVVSLYINPDPTLSEAEQAAPLVNIDTQSDYTDGSSKIKINLRQRGIGAKVGGIRVGTSWEDVLQGTPPVEGHTFNVDMNAAGLVEGDRLFISGSPWNWPEPGSNPDLEMFDTDGDGIYSLTTPLCPNVWAFKFFKNTGWGGGEPVSADRVHKFAEEDETLDLVWGTDFNDLPTGLTLPATFEVTEDLSWVTFSTGPNPFVCENFAAVPNPDATGINTSATALQFVVNDNADQWAGAWSNSYMPIEFTQDMHMLSMMVYRTAIGPVGLKVEQSSNGGPTIEKKVSNTVTDQWELLTFDFTAGIGFTYPRLVFFPDFPDAARTSGATVLVDDIGASVSSTGVSSDKVNSFKLYPNPVSGVLNIKLSDTNARNIEIYNVLGVLVHSERVDGRSHLLINTSDMLTKGVYFVKINNNSGSQIEQLIVK
jgi:hypothetical protein